jgi:dTDP-4-dehydrorhamnose 3,5-epimerase
MFHKTTPIDGLMVITPEVIRDGRGYFAEVYRKDFFDQRGVEAAFVQDNRSLSKKTNVVRGLHFQAPPFAQDKLIGVLRGRILDVAVDIRRGSPTYGQHFSIELADESMKQLFVPKGFAHGFLTLEDETVISYKTSNYYAPTHDFGVFWADPTLDIRWGVRSEDAIVSARDARLPMLNMIETPFTYDG